MAATSAKTERDGYRLGPPFLQQVGWGRRLGLWLQLAPASVYYIFFFFVPLCVLVAYSFFTVESFQFVAKLNLENYKEVFTSPIFRPFFFRTMKLAFIISLTVLALSYPFAYIIAFVLPRRRQLLYFLVLVSLFGGYLVRIYAWRTMLGSGGFFNQSLMAFGLIDEPLRVFLNSQFAIVIAQVNFLIPLGILPIYSAMNNVSPHLVEAARDLGSSRMHAAWKIVMPLSIRGVRAAFAFSFIAAAAEWVTPSLLGGPRDQLVGNQIAYQFGTNLNWPLGAALAISLVAVVLVIVAVVTGVMKWSTR